MRTLDAEAVPVSAWPGVRGRLKRVARLSHPYLARWVAVGDQDGALHVVSEWMPGGTLSELGPVAPDLVLRWVEGLADAVHVGHDAGVAHGAIDLDHVLLDEHGTPRLVELGLQDVSDPQQDLVALGRVLELLVPVPTPAIEDVIRRAVSGRFADASDLREAVAEARWAMVGTAPPDPGALVREDRRRLFLLVTVGILTLLIVVAAVWGFLAWTWEPPPDLP